MDGYKRLLSYAPEKKRELVLAIFFTGLSAIAQVFSYFYIWKFLEALLASNNLQEAMQYAVVVIVLLITYIFLYFIGVALSHILGFRVETNLRKKSALNVVDGSFHFFDNHSSGEVNKIINENASNTHSIIAHMIPDITSAIIAPILLIIVATNIDITFGVLLFLALIFAFICLKGMMSDSSFMEAYLKVLERLNGETVEYVRGMQVVKIFGASVYTFKSFYEAIKEYSNLTYQHAINCKHPYVSFQTILNLYISFTIPYGIYTLTRGSEPLEIAAKVIFFAIIGGVIFTSMTKIMYVGSDMFMAKEAVDKMENLFEEMEEKKISHSTYEDLQNTNIEFKDVTFSYENAPVIENLSFKLEGGKSYALIGGSGSGKSTIAKLIGGFYKVDSGQVLIGDKLLESYSEEFLNNKIAMVFQNAQLFDLTVFENVKLARPEASDQEVMQALKDASCRDIIDKLPQGVHTMLGTEGVSLSGGETQRIAIARAILKDADIVILDEASAAADADNEYKIQQAFAKLMEGKTVIMIAHRLTSIRNVDEILVMSQGQIIERGDHETLMAADSKYKEFQEMYAKANEWRVKSD
ncbi:ABC transporter ATP-binding protein [Suicoccus acidiformans]|uniref:ABC transporter ATP-binding protein n=1 Tax=Suicoccus acidiformans TaxID=2036206 RepID=A0A347WJ70_9LACT|nr:ABC transporter ATP-binding protein [Suicoccus acidiformans]AXY25127.1 ABC transporter ATP-binding protein [Suicoccus acidiformans]